MYGGGPPVTQRRSPKTSRQFRSSEHVDGDRCVVGLEPPAGVLGECEAGPVDLAGSASSTELLHRFEDLAEPCVVASCGYDRRVIDPTVHDISTPTGSLSYHRLGSGPITIVGPSPAFYGAADLLGHREAGSFLRQLASFATVILMDRRGLGWSDPLVAAPSNEQQVSDLVMLFDHAGISRGALLAFGFDAQPVLAFAAAHPSRVSMVICVNTTPKLVRADDHPTGMAPEFIDQWLSSIDPQFASREHLDMFDRIAPSRTGEEGTRTWFRRAGRQGASPGTARLYVEFAARNDVRHLVPLIGAPILVCHTVGNRFINFGDAEVLASLARNASLHALAGENQFLGGVDQQHLIGLIERGVTGRVARRPRRAAQGGWTSLTPAERRVGDMVAAGRSNPDIANALGISAHTVKTHVTHMFAKLGVSSRAEMASLITRERS